MFNPPQVKGSFRNFLVPNCHDSARLAFIPFLFRLEFLEIRNVLLDLASHSREALGRDKRVAPSADHIVGLEGMLRHGLTPSIVSGIPRKGLRSLTRVPWRRRLVKGRPDRGVRSSIGEFCKSTEIEPCSPIS